MAVAIGDNVYVRWGLPDRTSAIENFLACYGWNNCHVARLAGDASFRSYARLHANGRRAILMDAPPPRENVRPFVDIGRHLTHLGLSAPQILAVDEVQGLLLLEDFGDDTFTRLIRNNADEHDLYALAVDVLAYIHTLPQHRALPKGIPGYDVEKLIDEALLFVDWYLPNVIGAPLKDGLRAGYIDIWRHVLLPITDFPPTLVLRDFHVDNLMRLPGRSGLAACGLLDFQDAVAGHPAYDLMSLLEDARRDVSAGIKSDMLSRYFAAVPIPDRADFESALAILAAQRHAKVIGIFTRLFRRDGKADYLVHIPRVWRLLRTALAHPSLAEVAQWFELHAPYPSGQPREALAT